MLYVCESLTDIKIVVDRGKDPNTVWFSFVGKMKKLDLRYLNRSLERERVEILVILHRVHVYACILCILQTIHGIAISITNFPFLLS